MKMKNSVGISIILGSILLCDPAEGVKNQTMSPHSAKKTETQNTDSSSNNTSTTLSEHDQQAWNNVLGLSKLTPKEVQDLIKEYASLSEDMKKSAHNEITQKKMGYVHTISNPKSTPDQKSEAMRLKAINDLKSFIIKGKYPKSSPNGNSQPSQQIPTETKPSNSSAPSQSTPAPALSETPSSSQDPDVPWTNKYDIKVIYVPIPGKNEKDAQLTLIFSNKENIARPLKLESNPLVIPAGSLKAMIADLSDAHHNKEGKVIDAQGKVVPSGSIKSPDGFETYIDRNPLPPGIGCAYSHFTTGPNNGQFTIDTPELTHIIFGSDRDLMFEYVTKNNITGNMRGFDGNKINWDRNSKDAWGSIILVYKPS